MCHHENNVPSRLSPNDFVATHALGHMTVHHVPKYMSCHKANVVITGRAHCFHDNMITIFIYIYIYICMYIYIEREREREIDR